MIEEAEFERRVEHWFGLVMKGLETSIARVLKESKKLHEIRRDDPNLCASMEEADVYRLLYLPEEVLAHYLDPLMPPGYFDTVERADYLLHMGMAQRQSQCIALHTLAKARVGWPANRLR